MTLPPENPPEVPEPPGYAEALARLKLWETCPDGGASSIYPGPFNIIKRHQADQLLVGRHCSAVNRWAGYDYRQGWADCRAACAALNAGPAVVPPPDPSDVSAAEGRLRRVAAGERYHAVYPDDCLMHEVGPRHDDEGTLARAWLAESDPTPLTEEWLLTQGAVAYQGSPEIYALKIGNGGPVATLFFDPDGGCDGWRINDSNSSHSAVMFPSIDSRGQLLTLLRVLGVPPRGAGVGLSAAEPAGKGTGTAAHISQLR